MRVLWIPTLVLFLGACATMRTSDPSVSILVDLDPASIERNAIVTVTPQGQVQQVAKNDSRGPLEFPSAIVFVGDTAHISNYDTPRRDNLDANGKSALDGIGASIAQILP